MSARPLVSVCAACAKRMPVVRKIYRVVPPNYKRTLTGTRPAPQPHRPFCTLRCALAFARQAFDYGFVKRRGP